MSLWTTVLSVVVIEGVTYVCIPQSMGDMTEERRKVLNECDYVMVSILGSWNSPGTV
jgi:hypothetical protein